jgi:hypothetical protein
MAGFSLLHTHRVDEASLAALLRADIEAGRAPGVAVACVAGAGRSNS